MGPEEDSLTVDNAPPDELLRYAYRLDTLFDVSRSLFSTIDAEEILRTCLLSAMGNFGVLKGFILVFELPACTPVHAVFQGIQEEEIGTVCRALSSALDLVFFEPSAAVGLEQASSLPAIPEIECVLPFRIDLDRVGWMGVGPKIIGDLYSAEEKKLLTTLKNSLVVALQNARSFDEIKRLNADLFEKKARLEATVKELEATMIKVADYSRHLEKIIAALNVAQEVQQNLLPQRPPAAKGVDIAGTAIYCDETGGDYYDYIEMPFMGPEACALVVGDVSGHGISSALLMAGVRAYLRGRAMQPGSAAEVITDVNRLVAADTANTYQFMTLFFLVIDPRNGKLLWVNAGHDPALLYDPVSDRFEELRGGGVALGVDEGVRYKEQALAARPGQVIVLTTDGVFEAHDSDGRLFGKDRFREVIRGNAGRDSRGIVDATVAAVGDFRGAADQNDDITLVVAKFKGPQPAGR